MEGAIDVAVEHVVERAFEDGAAVNHDEHTPGEGGPVVGGFVAFAPDHGDADADGGGGGCEGIGAMMPGVAFEGVAIEVIGGGLDFA